MGHLSLFFPLFLHTMNLLKRGDSSTAAMASIGDPQTTTTTTTRTYTLPKIYTPLSSKIEPTPTTTLEDPGSYGITLFTPHSTESTQKTSILDPEVTGLPSLFTPLPATKSYVPLPTETAEVKNATSISSTHSGLSGGQIAGIVIGSVFGSFLVLYVFYVVCWNRRRARATSYQGDSTTPGTNIGEKNKQNLYHIDDFDRELMDDEQQNNYTPYTDDDQPVGLPRTQPIYNPQRVYSTTCIPNNPKEDFRSYYRTARPVSSSSDSSESSSKPEQPTATTFPYYGGFNPVYAPYIQQPPNATLGLGIHTEEPLFGASSATVHQGLNYSTPEFSARQ